MIPKRLIVLVKPKSGGHDKTFTGVSRLTCASHLSTSDASDTMNFWNNLVNIYDKLSLIAQDITGTLKGFFLCADCLLLVAETE